MSKPMEPESDQPKENRRGILTTFLAGITALLAGIIPPLAGLGVLLDPLRRKSGLGKPIRVTTLAALPADGVPRKFPVLTDRSDAWNQFRNVPIGAVYLRRTEESQVEAFNVACPHAGCFVDFRTEKGDYLCPCHNSTFAIDGSVQDPNSPSPRGLDSLIVEVRNGEEVWVQYQKFQAGHAEKHPAI